MQKLYTADQIKIIDDIATTKHHINPIVLMENAATNVSNIIRCYFYKKKITVKKIAVFCGTGNNGGDGLAIARHLSKDFDITVFLVGQYNKLTNEALVNFNIVKSIPQIKIEHIENIEILEKIELNYDCLIDAIIGVGFSSNLRPLVATVVEIMNKYKTLKIAIDIPTGLNSDKTIIEDFDFKCSDHIFKANLTISILGAKVGMYANYKTKKYCGKIRIANLDIGGNIADEHCHNYLLEKQDVKRFIDKRNPNTNKFDYGRIVIIAGSNSMAGAAVLSANAAITTGAGIVQLFSTKIHSAILPEIIAEKLSKTEDGTIHQENYDYLLTVCRKADVIVVGPGLGRNKETLKMIKDLVIANSDKKIVVDADALSVFNTNDVLTENIILTPHLGEFCRLLNNEKVQTDKKEIEKNKIEILKQTAHKMQCTILLKGSTTVISDGDNYYWNIYGNAGMATAGSGDVLTGIIAAILAKKNIVNLMEKDNLIAQKVAVASLVHSLTGENYVKKYSMETLTASNLIDNIKFIL